MPTKVYRGFESPSLRQEKGTGDRDQGIGVRGQRTGKNHNFFLIPDPYILIPKILIAGSRAMKGCKPRQIRKEATVAISDVCCG